MTPGAIFAAMTATVAAIRRYPVKGLSPETLDEVQLAEGEGLPGDRGFALALGSTPTDGPAIPWMPKTGFLTLLAHEKLAVLKTRFDTESGVLVIERGGKPVARGKITDSVGRALIEEFFAAYMGDAARGRPKLVRAAPGEVLSDHSTAVVSFINLASVRDLERVTGAAIDPVRFRGNIYLEGAEAWSEFDWVGREITVGGVGFTVSERIGRYGATNVDPQTGTRDLNLPGDLKRGFGHTDMGIYATVTAAGRLAAGDPASLDVA